MIGIWEGKNGGATLISFIFYYFSALNIVLNNASLLLFIELLKE